MLLAVIAAAALLLRLPIMIVVVMVALSLLPVPVAMAAVLAAGAASVAIRARNAMPTDDESMLLRQLSGRVAAGATIRSTIADPSIVAIPDRARTLAALGRPMTDVGSAIEPVFPVNGAAFRAICSFSEHTGAALSTALSVLAERADEAAELVRQRRVVLAQVKLSAVVVGLVPIAASIGLLALRGVPEPGGAAIVAPMVLGVALQAVGTGIVFAVASRAR